MTHSEYTAFWRNAAERHLLLRHDQAADAGQKSFIRISLSQDQIQGEIDLQEFLNALKHQARFPLMVLVTYIAQNNNNRGDHRTKRKAGAFYILDRAEKSNYDDQEEKIDSCEEIADDLIGDALLRFEALADYGSHQFDEDSVITEVISGLYNNQFYGVKSSFEWTEFANAALMHKPNRFVQPTPPEEIEP